MTTEPEPDSWEAFYAYVAGREPRPLLVETLDVLGPGAGRQAVDLGCGDGTDTLELVRRGWRVLAADSAPAGLAILRGALPEALADRVTAVQATYAEVVLPAHVDLVNASYSLPFCAPDDWPDVWSRIAAALDPGGTFTGQLFGDRDSWAGEPDMTFVDRATAEALFAGWAEVDLREREEDGKSAAGPKHWHVFDVIARR